MERIKSFISPRTRRKKLDIAGGGVPPGDSVLPSHPSSSVMPTPKTFCVSLTQLMKRAPLNATVPFVVSRICHYLYKHGLDSVGLFRVSGSVRIVERMRMTFELTGDVDLEGENDVPAAAGLLRVFLRDLPETLVPEALTKVFFSLVQDNLLNTATILPKVRQALALLPPDNLACLKYVVSLLVVVAQHKGDNKMSDYALAIVFGPNIFKYELTSGVDGLRDMDSSKDVMQMFISQYEKLFLEEGEAGAEEFWSQSGVKKTPPARPPPPKVQSMPLFPTTDMEVTTFAPMTPSPLTPSLSSLSTSVSCAALDYRPVPSPRKIKNIYDSNCNSDSEVEHSMNRSPPTVQIYSCVPLFSPRDDIDHSRAHSPFALESETHSIMESPIMTARTSEFVEKTIEQTISEHIFGGWDFNQNAGSQGPKSPQKTSFDSVEFPVESLVVRPKPRTSVKPHGFTTSLTNHVTGHMSSSRDHGESDIDAVFAANGVEEGQLSAFDTLERTNILTGHKKPTGPPRRSPSRKHRRSWEGEDSDSPSDATPQGAIVVANGVLQPNHTGDRSANNNSNQFLHDLCDDLEDRDGDGHTTQAKSMRRGDNLVNGLDTCTAGQADRSPSNGMKLFIPPLDFTTLHKQMEGTDRAPPSQPPTQAWSGPSTEPQLWSAANHIENTPMVSPQVDRIKNEGPFGELHIDTLPDDRDSKAVTEAPMSPSASRGTYSYFRGAVDTDVPPSPPTHQDLYKKHSDEDCSYRLRQLTKKIQGFKKKIKHFEEGFERDHGYRPSQGEKASHSDIKKCMGDLAKARKDLKQLKENTEKGVRVRHNSGASSGMDTGSPASPPESPCVSGTLTFILKCLQEKRREAGRPEQVMLMSRDQVLEEKLAVQRALLHFEGLHGRPVSKEEKDLMRPLYDRYRSIKRTLARPLSPRNSLEQIPEDQMIELPASNRSSSAIRIPTADQEEESPQDHATFGLVTRDLNLLRELDIMQRRPLGGKVDDTGLHQAGGGSPEGPDSDLGDAHLHELTLGELHLEMEASRAARKKLRRTLRGFEDSFLDRTGRKVQKEDRYPLEKEYSEYKRVKARLRLMEALVLKHHE